jgi:hypothetical protein
MVTLPRRLCSASEIIHEYCARHLLRVPARAGTSLKRENHHLEAAPSWVRRSSWRANTDNGGCAGSLRPVMGRENLRSHPREQPHS